MDQENSTKHENQEIPQFEIKSENSKIQEKLKCDICDKIIGDGNPEILRNHKMIYHEQILRYNSENDRDYFYCKFCTKEFKNEISYRNHQCGSQLLEEPMKPFEEPKKTIVKHVKKPKRVQPSRSKKPLITTKEPMKQYKEPMEPSEEPLKPSKDPKKPSKELTKEPMEPSKVLKKSNFSKLTKVNNTKGTKIGMKKLGKLKLQLPSNACKTCGKRFKDKFGAKRHQMFVHDKTLRYNGVTKQYFFHCKFCQIEFKKQVEFEGHQCEEKPLKFKPKIEVKKIEEKIFKIPVKLECDICDMEFFSEQKMKSHLAKYHFKCHFCAKIFDTKWYLYDHQETEHGIKKFEKCSLCPDQKFSSKELLQMHSKSEHKIDNGKCICFTLDFEEILVKHWDEVAKSVVPEPSVEYVPPEVFENEQFCGICDFSTKIYSELETHVLTHPDEIQ